MLCLSRFARAIIELQGQSKSAAQFMAFATLDSTLCPNRPSILHHSILFFLTVVVSLSLSKASHGRLSTTLPLIDSVFSTAPFRCFVAPIVHCWDPTSCNQAGLPVSTADQPVLIPPSEPIIPVSSSPFCFSRSVDLVLTSDPCLASTDTITTQLSLAPSLNTDPHSP